MVVVDVPVDTGEDAVGGRLDIIRLPGTQRQPIRVLQVIREPLQFTELRTMVCRRPGWGPISRTGRGTCRDIILYLAVDEEEQLILEDRTAESQSERVGMSVIHRQGVVAHTGTLQTRGCEISIDTALELIRSALGDGIDATARETTLTHIIGGDGDRHLVEGIEGDRGAAARQWGVTQAEGIIKRGTVNGDTRLAVVTATDRHATGRTALRCHLHDIRHATSHRRHDRHRLRVEVGDGTGAVGTHGIVLLCHHDDLTQYLTTFREDGIDDGILSQIQLDVRELL